MLPRDPFGESKQDMAGKKGSKGDPGEGGRHCWGNSPVVGAGLLCRRDLAFWDLPVGKGRRQVLEELLRESWSQSKAVAGSAD